MTNLDNIKFFVSAQLQVEGQLYVYAMENHHQLRSMADHWLMTVGAPRIRVDMVQRKFERSEIHFTNVKDFDDWWKEWFDATDSEA